MADDALSLQAVFGAVEQLDFLQLPSKVSGLADLVTTQASNASGAVRVYLQGCFCGALLKSMPTQSAAQVTSTRRSQHDAVPANPSRGQQPSSTTTPPSAAEACWASAGTALQTIYSWEDEEVVLATIDFWNTAAGLLSGSACQQQQHQQQQQHTPAAASQDITAGHPSSPQQANPAAHPSTAAASQAAPSSPELKYLAWLWAMDPAGVAAVVQQLHTFWRMTGLNPLQQHQGAAHYTLNLLLLFMHLHHSSTSSGTTRSTTSSTSSPTPVLQLLQLLHTPHLGSAHGQSTSGSLAAAMTAGEAFSGVCCLLQAAAVMQQAAPQPHAGGCAVASWCKLEVRHGATQHFTRWQSL